MKTLALFTAISSLNGISQPAQPEPEKKIPGIILQYGQRLKTVIPIKGGLLIVTFQEGKDSNCYRVITSDGDIVCIIFERNKPEDDKIIEPSSN